MNRNTVFLPAADRYLPTVFALASAAVILVVTQTWGIAVLREQFAFLQTARALAGGASFDFFGTPAPAGPLWPLLLSVFARRGIELELGARLWQAAMAALLVYVVTRFYLRHIRSRAVVAGAVIAFVCGVLLLSEPFTISPLLTSLLLLTCGTLALARFLYNEGVFAFICSAVLFGAAALLWIPATVLALGAAFAILLGGRGVLARRFSGVVFFAAIAVAPAALVWIAAGLPKLTFDSIALREALESISAFALVAGWPWWLRMSLTVLLFGGLLYVYLSTRGPAGIGPALKRRELQVWVLLSYVWLTHLLLFPTASSFVPLLPCLIIWPALGIDSFRDFSPFSSLLHGRGAKLAAGLCVVLLVAPLWQTVLAGLKQYQAGDGLRGFTWQTAPLIQELRASDGQLLYTDAPEMLRYITGRAATALPADLRTLDLSEGRIVILGDSCPQGLCQGDSTSHPTLSFAPALTTREGMLYDIRFRPPEPALTVSDTLTVP